MNHCLGKLPARPGAISFKLSRYFNLAALPTPPAVFGHQALVSDYGILGNNQYGDCVLAGGDHEEMLWNAEAGVAVAFTDANALSDYTALTGFNPADPATDQGTDMQAAASYRRTTGLIDANGVRSSCENVESMSDLVSSSSRSRWTSSCCSSTIDACATTRPRSAAASVLVGMRAIRTPRSPPVQTRRSRARATAMKSSST